LGVALCVITDEGEGPIRTHLDDEVQRQCAEIRRELFAALLERGAAELRGLLDADGVAAMLSLANPNPVTVGGTLFESYAAGVQYLASSLAKTIQKNDKRGVVVSADIAIHCQKEFERATGEYLVGAVAAARAARAPETIRMLELYAEGKDHADVAVLVGVTPEYARKVKSRYAGDIEEFKAELRRTKKRDTSSTRGA
jgi:hypothetical protein